MRGMRATTGQTWMAKSVLGLALWGLFVAASTTATATAAEAEQIEFRLKAWKTMEFDDAAKAKAHVETVTKIGCEVKQEKHGGHVDVTYRCPDWKKVAVQNHTEAHTWEKWLKDSGFETKHAH